MLQLITMLLFASLMHSGGGRANAYTLKCPNLRNSDNHLNDDEFDDYDYYEGGVYSPSDAKCESASENTRGSYVAKLKPCVFSFHTSDKDDGSAFRASTVCSDKNHISDDIIKEYVRMWPDECVGDFRRCYSVERDESIFRNFFCKVKPDWKIPSDTTHISVSCVDDKQALINRMNNRTFDDDPYFEREKAAREKEFLMRVEKEEEHMRHLEMVAMVAFIISFCACLVIVRVVYSWLLRPYYERLPTHDE